MKLVAAFFLACAGSAAAAPTTIIDTSFREANGARVQQLTVVFEAPVSKVWAALTTDDGFKGWAAPVAHVDLKNDGIIEASYSLQSYIGHPENIRNQIVAYVPEHMIAFHNVHVPKGAPADFQLLGNIRTVLELTDLGKGRTRMVESGVGYGEGEGFDALFKHFSAGNREEFESLGHYLAGHPVDWRAEAAKAKAAVGDKSE